MLRRCGRLEGYRGFVDAPPVGPCRGLFLYFELPAEIVVGLRCEPVPPTFGVTRSGLVRLGEQRVFLGQIVAMRRFAFQFFVYGDIDDALIALLAWPTSCSSSPPTRFDSGGIDYLAAVPNDPEFWASLTADACRVEAGVTSPPGVGDVVAAMPPRHRRLCCQFHGRRPWRPRSVRRQDEQQRPRQRRRCDLCRRMSSRAGR